LVEVDLQLTEGDSYLGIFKDFPSRLALWRDPILVPARCEHVVKGNLDRSFTSMGARKCRILQEEVL
jgi:hypothetical protein